MVNADPVPMKVSFMMHARLAQNAPDNQTARYWRL